MVISQQLHTVDEFEAFIALEENQDRRFELIHGEIVEKMPTEEHGTIVSMFHGHLFNFVQPRKLGRLVIEGRHKPAQDVRNARLPDIAFTHAERVLPLVKRGAVPHMPDLAIEVKSPDDTYKSMREKADFYLANGAQLVWLVYPDKRLIEVHTPDDFTFLTENDTLDGGDVLPGFTLPVRDVFDVE